MKWDIKKLGEVGNIYTGKTPSTTDQSNFVGSIPFATPSDLRDKIIKDTKRHVSEKGMKSLTLVREGSTLVGCIGDVGKVGYAAVPMTFNQQINAIEWDNKIIYDRYGYYTLLYMANVLKRKAVSSVVPILNKTNFSKVKIPIPPIENQKHMISLLDAANNILQLREEAIAKLDKLAQSVFESMFGSTKNNPKNFPVKKLKEIIKFEGGSQPPKSNFSDQQSEENIRLVQIRDFRTDKFKTYIPKNLAKRFFKKDDVMIGRYGPPVFQIFRGLSGSYNVALMKATPCDLVTKDFLYYLLREHDLHSYVVANSERTAGQSGVNLDLLENYLAYLPPIKEQEKFSHAISAYQSLKEKNIKSNKIIKKILLSLQSQLFGLN